MDGLLAHAPCGFLSLRDERTILTANATLSRWLGYEPADLCDRPFEMILNMGGRIFWQTHLVPLLQLEGHVDEIYLSLKIRQGGMVEVLMSASRQQHADGSTTLCAFLPMGERRKYEDELLQAKKLADEAGQAKARFLSMMSHELRTPMNAILGFGQLLALGGLQPDQAENVQYILKAGKHLLNLINEVLDHSRIDAGRLELRLEPVDPGAALNDVLEIAKPLAAAASIELVRQPSLCPECHVLADLGRLRQVLLNLVANGIKYNRPGGQVSLEYEVRPAAAATGRSHVRFRVSDTGHGISPENLPKLFTPFERLGAEDSAVEGTGLGLSLCRRLTEAMGGEIGVTSQVGEGSCFWVELPLVAAAEPLSSVAPETLLPTPELLVPPKPSKVLYIEDNASNRALIRAIFATRPNVQVLFATTGRAGLEAVREHGPDLILLDLQMHDLSGEKVLEHLQADPTTRHIPVVILSADATLRQRDRLLDAGAREYMTKPFELADFLRTVNLLLTQQKQPAHRSLGTPVT